jgi:hypothetical protein
MNQSASPVRDAASVTSSAASPSGKKEPSSAGQPSADGSGLTPKSAAHGDAGTPRSPGTSVGDGSPQAAAAEVAEEEQRRRDDEEAAAQQEKQRAEEAEAARQAATDAAVARKAKRFSELAAARQKETAKQLAELTAALASQDTDIATSETLLASRQESYAAHCSAKDAASAQLDVQRADIDQVIRRIEGVVAAVGDTDLDALTDAIAELEATAAGCDSLDHVWRTCLREDSVAAVTAETLQPAEVAAFAARLQSATQRYEVSVQGVEERLIQQDQMVKRTIELKTGLLRHLRAAAKAETKEMEERRRQLKIHEGEQRFHERRGTFVKERTAHPHADELKKEQERDRHTHLCADVLRCDGDVELVKGEVQGIRRDIENEKKEYEERELVLKRQVRELAASAAAASKSRAALDRENTDLKDLRSELATVLQVVRQRNRL